MMEPTLSFCRRKIRDIGSYIYRGLVYPFVKMAMERRCDSIIGKGAYLYKGCFLEGRDYIGDKADLANVRIGRSTYIGPQSNISNARIGRYCCIAGLETAEGRHPVKGECLAVHPAFYSTSAQYGYTYVREDSFEEMKYADSQNGYSIVIGNDVWIGRGVMILDGITVGDGAVVGANSLVTSDIEPYAIYAGTPARKVGERFDAKTAEKLLKLRWWDKDEKWIASNAERFANNTDSIAVDDLLKEKE